MSDLKSFVTLQARLYEFLAQQDETTLQALAGGTAQLAVVGADAAPPDLTKLSMTKLREVARSLRLRGYSKLTKGDLIALLTSEERTRPAATVPEGSAPPPPPARATSDIDTASVAAHLRELETEEEGAAYLRDQRLDREDLLAVAAELQLTRVTRLSQAELEKRVLKQAIGARRKFAGLRKW